MHECGRILIVFCPSQTLFISRTSQMQYHRKRYCSRNSPALSEHSSLASGVRNAYKNIATSCCVIGNISIGEGHLTSLADFLNTGLRCRVCSSRGKRSYIRTKCMNATSDSAFPNVSNSTTQRQHSVG
jgi:hypothetical protein